MHLAFEDEKLPAAARIKTHVLQIHKLLEELSVLAKEVGDDDNITSKIHEFYGEVLFNFMIRFEENYKRLPSISTDDEGINLTLPERVPTEKVVC